MKILILKPSSLGDVVQALPVLRLLKAHDPAHQVFWWISSELSEWLDGDEDLSGTFAFDRKRWSSPWHWREAMQSLARIRQVRFDWVIDLQGLARSSVVSWLVRRDLSIGVEDWREGAPALYDISIPRPTQLTHAVDWYLQVLPALRVPVHRDFVWLPPRSEARKSLTTKWQPGKNRWTAISPGARWLNKRWPAAYYAELVRGLAEECIEMRFVILGGPSDADLGRQIATACPDRCLDLTGKTSLAEMVEWIRISALVITNDTGPMHIAAALDRPILAIFGPTEPRRTGPYGQLDRVVRESLPCSPCLTPKCWFEKPMECLRSIRPAQVQARARELLNAPES